MPTCRLSRTGSLAVEGPVSRLLIPMSILAIMVVLVVGSSTAQGGARAASPAANRPLDLAAIVLYPRNLDALGLPGFGIVKSSLRDLETQAALDVLTRMVLSSPRTAGTPAAVTLQDDDPDLDERLAFYRDAGFRHRYTLTLLRPRVPVVETAHGSFLGDVGVITSVTEFDSAEKAASAFLVIEDERGNPNARDVPGTRPFGDQSEVTHSRLLALDQGAPYLELNLTFRVGALIADVSVTDFTGAEPEVATVEALAEVLQAKVTRAQAAPAEPQRWTNVARGLGKEE